MPECEYCKKNLANIYSLKIHQKTAKSCINFQSKIQEDNICWNCKYCKKEFKYKPCCTRHEDTCKFAKEQETQIKFELENKKSSDYETKNNFLEKKLKDQEKEFQKIIENEKNKCIKLEKENISLKTELKIRNEQISTINKQCDNLRLDIQSLNEKLIIRSVNTTNNTVVNAYNGIDFSQQRFDKHIEDNYTFELYEKGRLGTKILFIKFIYSEDNIIAEVSDDSRDKIKVMDSFGNKKIITFNTLLDLCRESKVLTEILQCYAKEYYKRPEDPLFPLCEDVKSINLSFKEKGFKQV